MENVIFTPHAWLNQQMQELNEAAFGRLRVQCTIGELLCQFKTIIKDSGLAQSGLKIASAKISLLPKPQMQIR